MSRTVTSRISAIALASVLAATVCAGCDRKFKFYEKRTYENGEVAFSRSGDGSHTYWIRGTFAVTFFDNYVKIDKTGNEDATPNHVWFVPRERLTYVGPAGAFHDE